MNTAGGNGNQEWVEVTDLTDVVRKFTEGEPLPDGVEVIVLPPRDPSVRDVLAQLDRIETKLDTLRELLEPKPLTPGYHGQYGSVPCA